MGDTVSREAIERAERLVSSGSPETRDTDEGEVLDCMTQLGQIMASESATDEEKQRAEELLEKLRPLVESGHSMGTRGTPGDEETEARGLVFDRARKEVVDHLKNEHLIDEKDVHIEGVLSDKGAFGMVYKGMYCGVPVAIKELRKDCRADEEESFRIEGMTLRLLKFPHICEYVGYMENPYRILTRFYPRDLSAAVAERGLDGKTVLTREDKFRIAYQLAAALLYLHKNGILHRDVKLDNILLDEDNNVKLADFGLSMYAPGLVYDAGTAPGSPLYIAPEVHSRDVFDAKCEVYTYGLMLYEIFTGRIAFTGVQTVPELRERQKLPDPLPIAKAYWSNNDNDGLPPREFWDFAKKCWSYDPKDRPSMEEVVTKIVEIGIKAAVPRSKTAENFWLTCSSFVYRDHLLLPEMVKRCVNLAGINMEKLIMEAVPKSWKVIKITDYWLLCCWFPNFFVSRESQKDMKRIVHSDWYVRDESEVRARIGDPKRQLFVIRPSSTNSFESPFTLCASVNGVVTYHRITRLIDQEKKCAIFICDTLIPGKRFMSITELGEFVKTDLHLSPASARSAHSLDNIYAQTQ